MTQSDSPKPKASKTTKARTAKKTTTDNQAKQTTDTPPTAHQPRLYRTTNNALLGGVAAGLGEHFHLDPTLIRIAFVALAFYHGLGIILYLALWLLVPLQKNLNQPSQQTLHTNVEEIKTKAQTLTHDLNQTFQTAPQNRGLIIFIMILGIVILFQNHRIRLWESVNWLDSSDMLLLILIGVCALVLTKRNQS